MHVLALVIAIFDVQHEWHGEMIHEAADAKRRTSWLNIGIAEQPPSQGFHAAAATIA